MSLEDTLNSMRMPTAVNLRCCGPNHCGRILGDKIENNTINAPRYCMGDSCMAWKWRTEERGYCGLASK